MTEANCRKYLAEAKTEEDKKFWADRIKRKYPEKIEIKNKKKVNK